MASSTILISAAVLLSSVALIFGIPIGNTRIVGGKRAVVGQFPYVVAINVRIPGDRNTYELCTGSILSDKFVLTAARCNLDLYPTFSPIRVNVGAVARLGGDSYSVKRFIKHPKFDGKFNDIALIELSTPIKLSQNASTIELNRKYFNENLDAVVAGFGSDEKGQEIYLNYANVDTLTNAVCWKKLPEGTPISDNLLCAMGVNYDKGVCFGDAGAPLVRHNKLIGVATSSYQPICDGRAPTVYTRVSIYVDWIKSTMTANE